MTPHRTSLSACASVLSVLASLLAGCSRPAAPAPADDKKPAVASSAQTAPSAGAAAPAGTLALGERVTSPLVPLADIAKDPGKYEGQVLATSGKVTAVCQEMGCWMELQDSSGRAHIRMHGHQFFVPKTSPGHVARVQATLVPRAGGANSCGSDCEGTGATGATGKAASAQVELDATGVEID